MKHVAADAVTRYKTRINEKAIVGKHRGSTQTLIDSSVKHKTHNKTPAAQYQTTQHKRNKSKTRKQTRYQAKAVRPSLRTHQNFEAATHYKTRIENLTAVKTKLTAVKTTLTDVKPNLYKLRNVRIPIK